MNWRRGLGHLHLTMNLLVPLAAWVLVRYMRGKLGGRGLALRLGAIAVCQFMISPEILSTMVVVGALGAIAAYALLPEHRPALRRTIRWSAVGLAGAAVVLSPLLVTMLRDAPSGALNSAVNYSTDLLNLIIPSRVTGLGGSRAAGIASHFAGNLAERDAYLGIPLLLLIAWFGVSRRRNRTTWLLLALLVSTIVLSLGPRLQIAGHLTIWLPGMLLQHVPLLKDAIPARFSMYTALVAGVVAARWLADRPARQLPVLRWLLASLAVLSLAPSANKALWWTTTPRAVSTGALARALPRGSTAIALPFWDLRDRALYAQAASGMRFRLVDRWMQDMPRQDRRLIVSIEHLTETSTGGRYHARAAALERDLREAGIQYVIVWGRDYTVTHLMAALHLRPERVDGVLVYRVAGQQTSAKSHPSNTRLQTSHASPTNGLPRRARVTG